MAHKRQHKMSSGGYCICPKCETKVLHKAGTPCIEIICPQCSTKMLRENSVHHKSLINKKGAKQ